MDRKLTLLAEIRKFKNMTQKETAIASGLSERTIRNWEKEGVPGGTFPSYLVKYCKALNCTVSFVLHFSDMQKEMQKTKKA